MTPKEQLQLVELLSRILEVNQKVYDEMLKNLESENFCPHKETAIKAAGWEHINNLIKEYIKKEREDGDTCTRDRS